MDIRSQISMVFHLDKCIGCHTCSIACKNIWTDRKGADYMWWNNVETKPGTGYPTKWENQDIYQGGWKKSGDGVALRGAGTDSYEFQVFGTDYDTPDGTAIRDYIHVCDLASAHLKALDHLQAGGESAAINLGTGTGTSVLEIRDAVEAVTGRKIRTKLCPRRQGDPSKLVARPDKALEMLGWRAERSDIRTIIEDAWTWHQAEMARAGA